VEMKTSSRDPQLASLPASVHQRLVLIEGSGPLGTSAVIGAFGEALELLAADSEAVSAADLADQALSLAEYYMRTRGRFSVAVENCFSPLRSKLISLQAIAGRIEEVRNLLRSFSREQEKARKERQRAVAAEGAEHLSGTTSLLLYDHSSTVMNVVTALVQAGGELTLVVPESRTCAGFLPILRRGAELQCGLRLIPDAALAHAMPFCDTVLVGVETFFADGSFSNTVGTLTTAIVAKNFGIPFYAVTELTKAAAAGASEVQPQQAFFEPLADTSQLTKMEMLEVNYPPLELVPKELVTGFITEKGVLEPGGTRMNPRPLPNREMNDTAVSEL